MKLLLLSVCLIISLLGDAQCRKSKETLGVGMVTGKLMPVGYSLDYANVPQEARFGFSLGVYVNDIPSEVKKDNPDLNVGFNVGFNGALLIRTFHIPDEVIVCTTLGSMWDPVTPRVYLGTNVTRYIGKARRRAINGMPAYDFCTKSLLFKLSLYL